MTVNFGIQTPTTAPAKKSHAVRNGAAIATGVGVAGRLITYKSQAEFVKSMGKGKYAAFTAFGLAICAAVGAGIGAIVKACKKD